MDLLLECSPVSVAVFKVARLLVGTVVADARVVQVVGGVGRVDDAGHVRGYHIPVLTQRVVVLPIHTVCVNGGGEGGEEQVDNIYM